MTHKNNSQRTVTPQEQLRTALAINRMPSIIQRYKDEADKIVQHHASQRDDYLIGVYELMNGEAFADTHSHTLDQTKSGKISEYHVREQLRHNIINLAHHLFDENGQPVTYSEENKNEQHKITAEHLAEFYIRMRNLKPFEYGNEITLNAFMEYFGSLSAFHDVNATDIDFRRLSHDQAVLLRESDDMGVVAQIFESALNPSLTPRSINKANEFGALGNREIEVGGIKFLGYQENGKEYLVTVNGGLVEKTRVSQALTQHFEQNKSVAEFLVKPERYLDIDVEVEGEKKKLKSLRVIDGYEVNSEGEAPLVCLGANIETGLIQSKHSRIVDYLRKNNHKLHDLHNVDTAKRLAEGAPEDIRPLLQLAAKHVRNITNQIDQAKDTLFVGKKPEPSEYARLVMSMGGPGSGKGAVADIVAAYTNDNYVEASLDKARNSSHLYHVLRKVGHHSDDYKMIEPFAKSMREWVANKARDEHFNLFYDGTGIEFSPRYDEIAKKFNDANYKTTVCMVDSMFIVPDDRAPECPSPVYKRIKGRLENQGEEQRVLPWRITVDKHRGVMRSFLDAFRSKNVEKVVAFCNDGPPNTAYLLAESFPLETGEFKAFEGDFKATNAVEKLKTDGSVARMLTDFYAEREKSANGDAFNKLLNKIPYFRDNNVAMICDDSSGMNKGLVITNATRMVDVAQKSFFNRNAAGPSSLLQCSKEFSFLVPQSGETMQTQRGEVPLQRPTAEYSRAVANKYAAPSIQV